MITSGFLHRSLYCDCSEAEVKEIKARAQRLDVPISEKFWR